MKSIFTFHVLYFAKVMELDTFGKYELEGDILNQVYNAQEKKYLLALIKP